MYGNGWTAAGKIIAIYELFAVVHLTPTRFKFKMRICMEKLAEEKILGFDLPERFHKQFQLFDLSNF